MMKTTRTFVELEVSEEAYLEIYTLLAEAGYHHAFIDGAIDMHGIALTKGQHRVLYPVVRDNGIRAISGLPDNQTK